MYIRSFAVGVGENDSTPVGRFVVRPASKLINPVWRNPRTSEFFAADDPENPIGERWVGLEGTGEIAHVEGYGIHGTIEPESIGQDASMGCVRLGDDDVAVVYECLEESVSEVHIRP
jgi:lipoprotein-anchoring transpeptidase ErfK/SrfK